MLVTQRRRELAIAAGQRGLERVPSTSTTPLQEYSRGLIDDLWLTT
jgi:hypothetical protein